jgi:hypothetical protein
MSQGGGGKKLGVHFLVVSYQAQPRQHLHIHARRLQPHALVVATAVND